MDVENDLNNDFKKQINITGQANRYQIKKLTQEKIIDKKRIETKKWELEIEYFQYNKQLQLLNDISNNISNSILNVYENDEKDTNASKILINQIEKKITSYKQQDIYKKILNNDKKINLTCIIDKLNETEIKCYYCKCEMLILYENVRDSKQWTVDRINNDIGHNIDNFVLACLDCNLKRRCKSADKFLFTKQLNIIKKDV
jgi:hypothetical protein